jgi:3-oxoacyl-[acyl-carrier-protein] synthase III
MKLSGIDCQIPSNKIINEDIIELVKYHSTSHYQGNISELEDWVRRFLNITGIKSRFWRSSKEKPIDLIKVATERALNMSGLRGNEIDMLIYSSIDRGFIEPANASFICKAIGLEKTRCFDIVDACMGWGSAVQTANAFLHSNPDINSIMIVNAEFPMDQVGSVLPNNFKIINLEELQWKSPSFTLGEGVSVCIFENNNSPSCKFEFIEDARYAELCTIALLNFKKFIFAENGKTIDPKIQFSAFGTELLKNGMDSAVEVFNNLLKQLNYIPKIIFPHSVSLKVIQDAVLNANITSKIYSTFPELGNLATASIPSSITKALLNNSLEKGDKCVGWIASAGMKFSAFEIKI